MLTCKPCVVRVCIADWISAMGGDAQPSQHFCFAVWSLSVSAFLYEKHRGVVPFEQHGSHACARPWILYPESVSISSSLGSISGSLSQSQCI